MTTEYTRRQSLPDLRTGPTVWYGPEMEKEHTSWLHVLSLSEIEELENAAEVFLGKGIPISDMEEGTFTLPLLGSKMKQLQDRLIRGSGFFVLRGLPVASYEEKTLCTIFYGIGTHLGRARSQNASGHLLGHVRNLGMDSRDPRVRLYQTRERQTFHTDSCDAVGLMCLQPAKKGGMSLLVSADTIYNEMYQRRPDLLALLLNPLATDRRGEVPAGMLPYLLIPVFSHFKGFITPFYQRQYIESAQRFPDAPSLTPKHIEALNLFDELCNSPDIHLTMMLEKGDMQFVYNHALLHDRTAFVDWSEPTKRRHLMRLWLSVPEDRPLPEHFASRFGTVDIGNRGGIVVPGTKLCVPLPSEVM